MPDEFRIMIGHHQYRLVSMTANSIKVWRIVGEICRAYLEDPEIYGDPEWRVLLKGFCDTTAFVGKDRAHFEKRLTNIGGGGHLDRGKRRLHVLRRLSRQLVKLEKKRQDDFITL